jgi:hypothetical protein
VDNLDFGLAMTVVGMGGTLLSLWALTLLTRLLKMIFPPKPEDGPAPSARPGRP